MLKRQSNEKISHGNTKQLKCSRLQEQVHANNTVGQAESSLERAFAENVLHCPVKIGKEQKKKQKKSGEKTIQDRILKFCCALYNAGGGVLEMPIVNLEELDAPQSDLDPFWQTVEARLKTLIEPWSYDDVYDREFDSNSGNIRLFIKKCRSILPH